MRVVEYNTEYSQNAFGGKTGNRARKMGTYKCTSCGREVTVWLDFGRLPVCSKCNKEVEWEFVHGEVADVTQAGH